MKAISLECEFHRREKLSRTYRKTSLTDEINEVAYINDALDHWKRHPQKTVKVRKTAEQYKADTIKADEEYRDQVNHLKKATGWAAIHYRLTGELPFYPRYVSRYNYYIVDVTREEAIAEAKEEYAEMTRDGRYCETGIKTGYRKDTATKLRRKNRRLCKKVMKGEVYDEQPFPDRKDFKYCIWNWW